MKTTTGILSREFFSLSTMLLLVLPMLMHTPPGKASMLERAEYSVEQTVADLPVSDFTNFVKRKAASVKIPSSPIAFGKSAGGYSSITASAGPIFLPRG